MTRRYRGFAIRFGVFWSSVWMQPNRWPDAATGPCCVRQACLLTWNDLAAIAKHHSSNGTWPQRALWVESTKLPTTSASAAMMLATANALPDPANKLIVKGPAI
jgi:hypothetical protein